jgi:hypothetical protein
MRDQSEDMTRGTKMTMETKFSQFKSFFIFLLDKGEQVFETFEKHFFSQGTTYK